MIAYALLVHRQRYDQAAVPTINLVTFDLTQAIRTAQNVQVLGFPFDQGGEVAVYRMEGGTILPRQVFERHHPNHPIIFFRKKDAEGEWVDTWLDENAKAEFYSVAA